VAAGGVLLGAGDGRAQAAPPGRDGHPTANAVHDVVGFGATGDGKTLCTAAIQRAIEACSANGGGTVLVPPGRFLSGALFLRDHVRLHLAAGATLLASKRPEDFPPIKGRDEGIERTVYASLITAIDGEGVGVSGQGSVDGQGESWWKKHDEIWKMRVDAKLPREAENPPGAPLKWPRPRSLNFIRCRDVVVEGITFRDGPFYDLHLVYCQDVVLEHLTIRRLTGTGTGTTGTGTAIAVDSSKRVRIGGCEIAMVGNGIGIKSGYNEDGRRVNLPSEDILITGCHLSGCGDAVAVGSETAGSIRNVLVTECIIDKGRGGVTIRSPRGRGGTVEHIRVCNVLFDDLTDVAVKVTHFFDSVRMGFFKGGSSRNDLEISRSRKAPIDEGTPTVRRLVFSGLTMGRVGQVALFEGLPERYLRGVVLEHVSASEATAGITCTLAAEVRVNNVDIGKLESAAVDAREVERLEIHRLSAARPRDPAIPVVWLENVNGAFVHGCGMGEGAPGYQWLRQEDCRRVTLAANDAPAAPAVAVTPPRR
jgi:hypothetical protein